MEPKQRLAQPDLNEPVTLAEAEGILQEMASAVFSGMSRPRAAAIAETPEHARLKTEEPIDGVRAAPRDSAQRTLDPAAFERLVELSPDAVVVIDRGGVIALVNAQTERLFGYHRRELLGQPIEILVPEHLRARHVAERNGYLAHPSARPMGIRLDLSGRGKNGHGFPVEISLSPLQADGELLVIATIRDISERKRLEARYRTLVEGIPAVTFMAALDETASEIYISPQIEQLLGFSQQEWLGDPFLWYRQLHPDDRQRWGAEFAKTCSSGVRFSSEYRFLSREGREVWVHGEARIVRDELGRPLFLQGIAFDITENKRAEQLLRRLTEELERKVRERTRDLEDARLRAESANRARASFLANMSHEIRTPLNGIIGFADLLSRGADTSKAERDEWLNVIYRGGKHLLELINDILDLSKIDAGKLSIEEIDYSPVKLIGEVCSLLRSRADEKGLLLETRCDGPLPATIRTDPTRLRQILMNIAGNAVKFTQAGSVRITARLDQSDGENPKFVVEVADTGVGIPADQLQGIFDPFMQADSSITRRFGGTGLGLAISRRLAHQLGGGITVESEVGRGATFTCEVASGPLGDAPLIEQPGALAQSAEPPQAPTPDVALDCRVLVVDDGDTNRKLVRVVLGRAGARVDEAENGRQAVDLVAREGFDVILMDMQMPVMDGYAATVILRERGCDVPIIALTANAMKGDAARCLEAGCSGYLAKPIDQDQLLAAVASSLMAGASGGEPAAPPKKTPAAPARPAPRRKLISTLPMDDADFREIVALFVERLDEKIREMRAALDADDWTQLAGLAHWLKGTSGGVGFPQLSEIGKQMEPLLPGAKKEEFAALVAEVEQMAASIAIE